MENFNFASSLVFKQARLLQVYRSPLIIVLRLISAFIFFISLLGLTFSISQEFQILPLEALGISIFGTILMFEFYFRHKISTGNKNQQKLDSKSKANLADLFTIEAADLLLRAQKSAASQHFEYVQTLHLFQTLLKHKDMELICLKLGLDYQKLRQSVSVELKNRDKQNLAKPLIDICKKSLNLLPSQYQDENIDSYNLFVACFFDPYLNKVIFDAEIKIEDLVNVAFWIKNQRLKERQGKDFANTAAIPRVAGLGYQWAAGYTFILNQFSVDLSQQTSASEKQYHLVGRDAEVKEMENILSRSAKANVLLVGEPGIGKTSIVQKFALRSIVGKTLSPIRFKRIRAVDTGLLLSGVSQVGELEERITSLIREAEHAGNIILYFDEFQNITGAKIGTQTIDLSGLIIPALSGEKLRIIASVTPPNYKRYIESRGSLDALFTKITVEPPSTDEAIRIITETVPSLEKRQAITITYQAIKRLIELSNRYYPDRSLPGKAIDILDEFAVEIAAAAKKIMTKTDVEKKVAQVSGIPPTQLTRKEKEKLLNLEKILHQRVIGQNEAIVAIADALRRARSGLKEPNQPIGTFLFLGPTGVGKTETAKALAEAYFGSEKNMTRLDMSEFQHQDSVFGIIGRPAGSTQEREGGYLTESVRNNPFSLILLDELEKAHPNILQLFLQIFDDGRLTDSSARTIDFSNTIIIATSNAGAEKIRQAIIQKRDILSLKEELIDDLQSENIFRPEFLNRFDDIIIYKTLSIDEVVQVVELMVKQIDARLAKKDIKISISQKAERKIAQLGYDPVFGARSLRRYLQDNIESVIAKKMIGGQIKRGQVISLDVSDLKDLPTDSNT